MATAHNERFDHHRGKMPLLRPASPLRMTIFLAICYSGYFAVNAFWLYLSGGEWMSAGGFFQPLGETFLSPLSVISHKWMIAVDGAALGLMIFVPIILSVLYRLVWAVPAVLVVAGVAHAPALALALALGCMLASRTTLRSDMPFVAVLLGLLPPGLYLMLFSSIGSESSALPVEQLLLKAPLLAALVTAVLSAAVVLALARLTDYRSGVVWPVVAVLTAGPMLLFFLAVGSDELEYNLITAMKQDPSRREPRGLLPSETLLAPRPLHEWRKLHPDLPPKDLQAVIQQDLQAQKAQLVLQCERFAAKHPRSPRTPTLLWVRAQVVSLRLDTQALAKGQVRYDCSLVSSDSAPSWATLLKEYGRSPQAALAQWRLAELAMREGRLADALAAMRDCEKRLEVVLRRKRYLDNSSDAPASAPAEGPSVLDFNRFADSPLVPRRVCYQIVQTQVREWLWIADQGRVVEDPRHAQAMRDWFCLPPSQPDYAQQLARLAEQHDKTPLLDLLRVASARCDGDPDRRRKALAAVAAKPLSPAYLWANFLMGEELLQASPENAARGYLELVALGEESPFKERAQKRLAELDARKEQR